MSNLVDVIRNLVDSIDLELNVLRIDGDKLFMCSTSHITIGDTIKDGTGLQYTVIGLSGNEWIRVEPKGHLTTFTGTTVLSPSLTFLHGDPKSTNHEYLRKGAKTSKKTPFVWLLESYSYEDVPRDSAFDEIFNVRLFFLDWANIKLWTNQDHNDNVVKPMVNLQRAFKQLIEDEYNFKLLERFRVTIRNRFGVNSVQPEKKIIDENLSGIEVNFKLGVYDITQCNC